ncbi:MAG: thioredoxin domain-containing protein [Myxococcales bacterium]|nr:thioredoxin domain-containing protein [Myxococcales bacterium]USN50303.1 MAG: thioredoxin domain-containing protein [Myxococcales bacterium]
MKKIVYISALTMLFLTGCQKDRQQLLDKIAQLEKRIEILEKKIVAQAPPRRPEVKEQTAAYDIPVGKSYVYGDPKAPVTVSVFSDYQCPFCSQAHEDLVEGIIADKDLKGKVKVVFKHFPLPFHQMARPASKAALAAGEQGGDCFWALTKKLYGGQKALSEENFKKWAEETVCKKNDGSTGKLNVAQFWKDYSSKGADYDKMIEADVQIGRTKAEVRGTPSFYVNGWKLASRNVDAVKQLIKDKHLL